MSRADAATAHPYARCMPASLAIAIDIGGTKVEAALVDEHGTVLPSSRHRFPTGRGQSAEELAESVRSAIRGVLGLLTGPDAAFDPAQVVGVGIGAAGPSTSAQGGCLR